MSRCKFNIFTNIEDKLGEEETCPICLEELKDLTTSITPSDIYFVLIVFIILINIILIHVLCVVPNLH